MQERGRAAEASLAGDDVRWASDQEISDYAEYLGMDPAEDGPLLWIAEHAACSPVPDASAVLLLCSPLWSLAALKSPVRIMGTVRP